MGAGHGHTMHFHGHSVMHRMPAHVKILALLGFLTAVIATPREQFWAFGAHALLIAAAVAASQVPVGYLARRLVIEVPFLVFALALPFVATGPTITVMGLTMSQGGLLAAWGLVAKGTLGVLASVLFAATTEPREVLVGLERLRLPRPLVEIMGFMIRYGDVVAEQARRMRIARESRGFDARSVRHWSIVARSAGAMFIRCFERGERVHLAMISRGYQGYLPLMGATDVTAAHVTRALVIPLMAFSVCAVALARQAGAL